MMREVQFFRYGDLGHTQFLSCRTEAGRFSLLVLLPRKIDGLAELEKSLTAENVKAWSDKLMPSPTRLASPTAEDVKAFEERRRPWPDIDVVLPKFKVRANVTWRRN